MIVQYGMAIAPPSALLTPTEPQSVTPRASNCPIVPFITANNIIHESEPRSTTRLAIIFIPLRLSFLVIYVALLK